MNPYLMLLAGYLIGSIPFGVMISRAKGVDLSKVGSGNVGATNVKRALGWGWALAVFALDVGKGLAPALAAMNLVDAHRVEWGFAAGLSAVAGHCASPFLKFRGGKGVASALGALLGSTPFVGSSAFAVFLVFMAAYRIVSLASIIASIAILPFDLMFNVPPLVIAGHALLIAFVIVRHRKNIQRIRRGEEPRLTFKN